MNIGIIGCGAYSLALSLILHKNNNNVTIFSESQEKIDQITKYHQLKEFLPNILISEDIIFSTSIEETIKNKDIIFIVVAAQYVENITRKMKKYLSNKTIICLATKGIDIDSCQFLHTLIYKKTNAKRLAILSGPGFAIDLALNNPIGLFLASTSKESIEILKKVLENETIKIKSTKDVIGIELCGCIKNIIAIASGIIAGLGYSDSTQALLITESIQDIKNMIKQFGGEPKTVLSYAGIGDIILTATSSKSRNFSLGKLIGQKASKKEIDTYLIDNTVEGYYSLKSIFKLLSNKNINIDFINILYDIIFNDEDPKILIEFLITKE